MLGGGLLLAFDQLAADARLAPGPIKGAPLAELAASRISGYRRVSDRLLGGGTDPAVAFGPYLVVWREYHERTTPSDWWEALVKAYIGDGIAADFLAEVISRLSLGERAAVARLLPDAKVEAFLQSELAGGIAADPVLGARLSLWARRLVGESVAQAGRIVQERPALAAVLGDEAAVGVVLRRLTTSNSVRMAAVGLNG